jgi:cytosine/adenosine deaminase-related metal-dependent hydrolase
MARRALRSLSWRFFMAKTVVLLALFCSTGFLPAAEAPATQRATIIRDVTIIDATGSAPQPAMTLVIRGERIADIGKASDVAVPESAQVIDGQGKFLIPGLWDMHGHLTDAGEGALAQLIENGVTGVRDLGGDLELVQRWRREITEGRRIGPHIVAAGPFLDGPNEAKHRIIATNEAEARAAIRSIKARGADFVKIHNALPREAFFAAADEARKQGIPLAVHLPREVTIAEASAVWATLAKNQSWFVPTMVAYERGLPPSFRADRSTGGRSTSSQPCTRRG